MNEIDEKLLRILVCPFCKKGVRLEGGLIVSDCGLKYAIKDGIPQMLYPLCPKCGEETRIKKEGKNKVQFRCPKCGNEFEDESIY